jgi:hypothetical protein
MTRIVTFPAAFAALAASCFLASGALADEKQVCSDAYSKAQTFRDAHKLTAAREQLRVCARSECPGFIAKDCAGWLKEVEPRIPSVVFIAKGAGGADLIDVKVSMDGTPLVTKLDGLAIDVDPGAHDFVFEAADGKAEQKVVVTEGAKAQRVSVTFGAVGAGATATTALGVATSTPRAASAPPPAAPAAATAGTAVTPGAEGAHKFDFFPKEPVESGVSVGFRVGYALPYGDANGGTNGNLSYGANGQVPFWFDAGYLLNPYLYLGAYFSYGIVLVPGGFLNGVCGESAVNCPSGDVRFGVDLQWRFLGPNALQPWIGIGFLGYERIHADLSNSNTGATATVAFDGIEWVTPQVGFDYKIFPALSAGVFAGISFSQYLGTSTTINGAVEQTNMDGNPLHGWVFLGGRVNYDLHL